MILTTHALTGAVIGKYVKNPWLVVLLSLVVHYLMDGIRHAEYFDDRLATVRNTWWKVTIDLAVGFSIIYYFIFLTKPDIFTLENIVLGVFFSLLPDGITLMRYFSGNKLFGGITKIHALAHRYDRYPKHSSERQWSLRNAVNDIIISLIAIILLFI